MKSFRDPETGVLTAFGYCEENGGDIARDEPDDFALKPGAWQLIDDAWQPYEAPPAVPLSVTMRQARLALMASGMLDAVNAAVDAMEGATGAAARIEWEFSSEVQRNKPLVQSMGAVLGLTESDLDNLFIQAASIP